MLLGRPREALERASDAPTCRPGFRRDTNQVSTCIEHSCRNSDGVWGSDDLDCRPRVVNWREPLGEPVVELEWIERASEPFSADGKQFAAGSYVIHMQQPFSGWAKTLLERQDYPDLRLYPGGPPKRPYDVTAQTLPMQMGVEVETDSEPPGPGIRRVVVRDVWDPG